MEEHKGKSAEAIKAFNDEVMEKVVNSIEKMQAEMKPSDPANYPGVPQSLLAEADIAFKHLIAVKDLYREAKTAGAEDHEVLFALLMIAIYSHRLSTPLGIKMLRKALLDIMENPLISLAAGAGIEEAKKMRATRNAMN